MIEHLPAMAVGAIAALIVAPMLPKVATPTPTNSYIPIDSTAQRPKASPPGDYGGMYSQVNWGASGANAAASNPTQTAANSTPNRTQIATSLPSNFKQPLIVQGGCTTDGGAEYASHTNTIHVCKQMSAPFNRFAIAHETGHAVDWQQDGKYSSDLEFEADKYAVNTLLQEGDCEAVRAKASQKTDAQTAYTEGTFYAREMLQNHCGGQS